MTEAAPTQSPVNILVIGGGGREHALCWKLARSPMLGQLYCAPGNPGIAQLAQCVGLAVSDHAAVIAFCRSSDIALVVVGPEQPLVDGLADSLKAAGIRCFGPSAAAARLEGSKGFTKDLCARAGIPTAAYGRFTYAADARTYVRKVGAPIVIKADGLAAGKGVIIAQSLEEALAAVDDMFAGSFGDAGAEVVIEEFMVGEEASFFALVDGKNALPLATAQDHKRVGDGDTGPNTGGMGAYSPASVMTEVLVERTMKEIITPTVAAMSAAGTPYVGVLYAGLMLTDDGPKLIEYNCRFGDPECQVLMLRMQCDLVPLLMAACDGALADATADWSDDVAIAVVMAAQGYPGPVLKDTRIGGLDEAAAVPAATLFHAGTRQEAGNILASGGRVLNICATGPSVQAARTTAYTAVDRIDWPEGFCRRDIGWRAVARESGKA